MVLSKKATLIRADGYVASVAILMSKTETVVNFCSASTNSNEQTFSDSVK
jgi:hypothetical protein